MPAEITETEINNKQDSKPVVSTPEPSRNFEQSTAQDLAKTVEMPKVEENVKAADVLENFEKYLKGDNTAKLITDLKPKLDSEVDTKQKQEITKLDPTKDKQTRDYSGFSDEEAKLLAKMSNDSFEYVSKRLKNLQTKEVENTKAIKEYEDKVKALTANKVTVPDNYYENPLSVYLLPEVQQIQQNVGLANQVYQYWQDQLIRIEKGEQWRDLNNDKEGNLVIGEDELEPSAEAKVQVMRYLAGAQNQVSKLSSEFNDQIKTFNEKSTGLRTRIKQAEKEYMPLFEDEAAAEFKVAKDIGTELEKVGISRHNPVFTMLSKSIALNVMLRDHILNQQNVSQKSAELEIEKKKAGPTSSNISGGASSKPSVSLDDFNKILRS